MNVELKTLDVRILEINLSLNDAYIIPVDKDSIRKIRTDIGDLLWEAVVYLKKIYSTMSPWQKDHIVEAINGLYWDWLNLALNSIRLSIVDPSTISPENKYKNEIIKLSDDDLIRHVEKVRQYLMKI